MGCYPTLRHAMHAWVEAMHAWVEEGLGSFC